MRSLIPCHYREKCPWLWTKAALSLLELNGRSLVSFNRTNMHNTLILKNRFILVLLKPALRTLHANNWLKLFSIVKSYWKENIVSWKRLPRNFKNTIPTFVRQNNENKTLHFQISFAASLSLHKSEVNCTKESFECIFFINSFPLKTSLDMRSKMYSFFFQSAWDRAWFAYARGSNVRVNMINYYKTNHLKSIRRYCLSVFTKPAVVPL